MYIAIHSKQMGSLREPRASWKEDRQESQSTARDATMSNNDVAKRLPPPQPPDANGPAARQ